MGLRAVFFDAGNTLVSLDYGVITERLRADGHRVATDEVRRAEQRARVRLDPHLGARSTETPDIFRLYLHYTLDGLGIAWDGAAERIADDLRAAKPPYGLWSTLVPE